MGNDEKITNEVHEHEYIFMYQVSYTGSWVETSVSGQEKQNTYCLSYVGHNMVLGVDILKCLSLYESIQQRPRPTGYRFHIMHVCKALVGAC